MTVGQLVKQRISAQIPWQMFNRLNDYLDDTGLTLSEVVRRALDAYLKSDKN